jgi:zinc protease
VYLIDRPDSPQALLAGATLVAPRAPEDAFPARYFNKVLGSDFSSRLNMNLREDKHWAYGAGTEWHRLKGPQLYIAQSSVQTDKAAEAMAEIRRELADIAGSRPVTAQELARVQRFDILGLGRRTASSGALSGAIQMMVTEGISEEYWNSYERRARAVTLTDIQAAAQTMIHPDRTIWVVVGDLERIESAVRALDFGPVQVIDASKDLYGRSLM